MMPGVTLTARREAGPHFFISACRVILSVFFETPPIVLFAL